MIEVYQTLCGEPWCWHPDDVSRLTDWQVWDLVLKPAIKRSKRLNRKNRPHGAAGSDDEFEKDWQEHWATQPEVPESEMDEFRLPSREEYCKIGMEAFGYSQERAEAEYDQAMSESDASDPG